MAAIPVHSVISFEKKSSEETQTKRDIWTNRSSDGRTIGTIKRAYTHEKAVANWIFPPVFISLPLLRASSFFTPTIKCLTN